MCSRSYRPLGLPIYVARIPRLHSRSYPRRFTFYVAEPVGSILDVIGIHMHSLKVAGGVILFLFGVQMLFGKMEFCFSRHSDKGGNSV